VGAGSGGAHRSPVRVDGLRPASWVLRPGHSALNDTLQSLEDVRRSQALRDE
jgi:hypothetical protein